MNNYKSMLTSRHSTLVTAKLLIHHYCKDDISYRLCISFQSFIVLQLQVSDWSFSFQSCAISSCLQYLCGNMVKTKKCTDLHRLHQTYTFGLNVSILPTQSNLAHSK